MDFRKEGSGGEDFGAFEGCFIFRIEGSLSMKSKECLKTSSSTYLDIQ